MKTILITGINGFLGSNLAKSLSVGNKIIGLEYLLEDMLRIDGYNFKVYSSKNDLEQIFIENEIDVVIHTATIYHQGINSITTMLETNVILPIKLYELCNKNNVNRFINSDSFFNDQTDKYSYLGEYTLTKKHCLDWLKKLQKKTKIINMKIFHMYGPGDSPKKFVTNMITLLMNNTTNIDLTFGEQERDFIYIDDILSAYHIVINSVEKIQEGFEEFEIGTGESISIRNFVELAAKLLNSKSKLNFGVLEYRKGENMLSKANINNISSLGWFPKFSLEEGIKKLKV